MVSTAERIPVLIAGAGNIGSVLIQHSLANPKLQVSILIRDLSKHKDLAAQVEAKGGKVFVGDAEQVEVLQEATKDIHTVVSTLYPRGDENKFINGQKLLIDAAVKNGVKRYYPTDYGFDDSNHAQELKKLFRVYVWQEVVQDYLKTQPIEVVRVRCGLWHFFFPYFFPGFSYYGDVNQKINFIDIDDTAELIVGTLVQKDFSGTVYFSGDRVSIDEAAKIYSKVKGTTVEAKRLGSLEELKAQTEEAFEDEQKNSIQKNTLNARYIMLSGLIYKDTDDNKRFGPNVEITPLAEFFKKNEVPTNH